MIIIRICGGLGNQMFQYSMYLTLKQKYPNQTIKTETFHYFLENEHNGLELEKLFNITLNNATKKELRKIYNGIIPSKKYEKMSPKLKKFILNKFQYKYLSLLNHLKKKKAKSLILDSENNEYLEKIDNLEIGDWYLRGFWQRTEYYENIRPLLMKTFPLNCNLNSQEKKILKELKEGKYIAVHVRGGDFINPKYNLCHKEYYKDAISKFQNIEKKLIIFTDDKNYAKTLLKEFNISIILSHGIEKSLIDMYMLSHAKNIIVSNSTFSFWGAYLSNISNQKVVAPKYASFDGKNYRFYPSRKNWIIINNEKK